WKQGSGTDSSLLAFMMAVFSANCFAQGGVSVISHGAVGDGEYDCTEAFRAAIAKASAEKSYVYVPRGNYAISQTLELDNVGISGEPVGAWPSDVESLPSILLKHSDSPGFRLLAGGSLRGLDITYRPKEKSDGNAAVLISGIGVYIANMRIRYTWDGILTDGINNVGRLNIENVFIVAVRNVGVRVSGTWDVPRLNNIEVWNAAMGRGLEKGVGFHLLKNDLIRVTDCFAFGMGVGFLLEDKMEGSPIEGGTWGVMTGCSTDFCGTGVRVKGSHTVSVTGGTFWQHHRTLEVDGADARVRFTGAEIKSNGAPAIVVNDADHVVVTGCTIRREMENHDVPAVVLRGGSTTLSANHIISGATGVAVYSGVRSAVIGNNTISSRKIPLWVDETLSRSRVSICGNLLLDSESGEAFVPECCSEKETDKE
ncbi:MAG TPA: glycosyl hydrolase family 28-related protein, partial [bacterium]|nr:glycosyl hydrolase family 28-related protein [bacterium]